MKQIKQLQQEIEPLNREPLNQATAGLYHPFEGKKGQGDNAGCDQSDGCIL